MRQITASIQPQNGFSFRPGDGVRRMGRAITGVLTVCGGALVGCVAYGALYFLVMSLVGAPLIGPPLAERAAQFGVSFGMLGGVMICAAALDIVFADAPWTTSIAAIVVMLMFAALAIFLLFTDGRWSTIFGGTGMTAPLILGWALISTGAGNLIMRRK